MKKLILLLFLSVGMLFGQTKYFLPTEITSASGRPIQNATVVIYPTGTTSDGITMRWLNAGRYYYYAVDSVTSASYDIYVGGYLWQSETWVGNIEGLVETADINDGAVTSASIKDATILNEDIANDEITYRKLEFGNAETDGDLVMYYGSTDKMVWTPGVTTSQIIDGTIVAADIATGGVATAEILNGTIIAEDLATGSVTGTKILDGTISHLDIAASSVENKVNSDMQIYRGDNIPFQANTVGSILFYDTVADGGVIGLVCTVAGTPGTWTEFGIIGLITAADIASNAIDSTKILAGAVRSGDILDGTITGTDIASGTVDNIDLTNNCINSIKIENYTIERYDIKDDEIIADAIATGAVATAEILDGTIIAADIASNAIDSTKILAGAVHEGDIADGAIAFDKLEASLLVDQFTWTILDTVYEKSLGGFKVPYNMTITDLSAFTDNGTVEFDLQERAETTPNTTGTEVLGTTLIADTNNEESQTFGNAAIAANTWLVLVVADTIGDVDVFSVTVRFVRTN